MNHDLDNQIQIIEIKLNELIMLINNFKINCSKSNRNEKRKVYNKNYYNKIKTKIDSLQ